MARPKKSNPPARPSPAIGDNGGPSLASLNDDQKRALHFHHVKEYEKPLEVFKAAQAALKNAGKMIKAEGGSLDNVKLTIALRTPEGEATAKADIIAKLDVMRWSSIPVGGQADLFGGPDRRDVHEKAQIDGKEAGLKGLAAIVPPQFSAASNEWLSAWKIGQEALMAILPLTRVGTEAVLIKAEAAADAEDAAETPHDDFDDALAGAEEFSEVPSADIVEPWPDDAEIASSKPL